MYHLLENLYTRNPIYFGLFFRFSRFDWRFDAFVDSQLLFFEQRDAANDLRVTAVCAHAIVFL